MASSVASVFDSLDSASAPAATSRRTQPTTMRAAATLQARALLGSVRFMALLLLKRLVANLDSGRTRRTAFHGRQRACDQPARRTCRARELDEAIEHAIVVSRGAACRRFPLRNAGAHGTGRGRRGELAVLEQAPHPAVAGDRAHRLVVCTLVRGRQRTEVGVCAALREDRIVILVASR